MSRSVLARSVSLLLAGALIGCAATLPSPDGVEITGAQGAAPASGPAGAGAIAGGQGAADATARDRNTVAMAPPGSQITSFRSTSVVAYFGESGGDAERLPSSAFHLPLPIRYQSPTTQRFQVQVAEGTRWIEAKDAVVAAAPAPRPR